MRRIVTALLSTITILVLLFSYRTSTNAGGPTPAAMAAPAAVPQAPVTTPTPGPTTTSAPPAGAGGDEGGGEDDGGALGSVTAPTPRATTAAPRSSSGAGSTVSGTFTGDAVMTRWGVVQVQISVSKGQITAATPVQYPHDNPRDAEINSYALPVLNQETLSAQSASIDMVSGATVTSGGYLQSLQSAIDRAHL